MHVIERGLAVGVEDEDKDEDVGGCDSCLDEGG